MDVYLDYNATAILRPEVITAMQNTFQLFGNSSSVHRAGRKAKSAIEEARERIASVVEVSPAEIIFTSGGTESNNLALSNRDIPVFISEEMVGHKLGEFVLTRIFKGHSGHRKQ